MKTDNLCVLYQTSYLFWIFSQIEIAWQVPLTYTTVASQKWLIWKSTTPAISLVTSIYVSVSPFDSVRKQTVCLLSNCDNIKLGTHYKTFNILTDCENGEQFTILVFFQISCHAIIRFARRGKDHHTLNDWIHGDPRQSLETELQFCYHKTLSFGW